MRNYCQDIGCGEGDVFNIIEVIQDARARMSRLFFIYLGTIMILLLTACERPAMGISKAAETPNGAATQAAFLVETEIARPTWTPTLPATPSPTIPQIVKSATPEDASTTQPLTIQVTPLSGLEFFTAPEIPDIVFQIDPTRWGKDPKGGTSNLSHKVIPNCSIESVLGSGLGSPAHLSWQDFGRFRWMIMDYGSWALANPVQGKGLNDKGNSFLHLGGYNQPACRSDQEKVLADLMTRAETAGEAPFVLFSSPTPRPALEGFSCPNTPPVRLRSGDEVSVITDGLWLRSAPSADSAKVRKFLRYPGVVIKVTGGPVCEKYVYWPVSITGIGDAGQTLQGWFAEGDLSEYYLIPVN
jgi:hypothetical protein